MVTDACGPGLDCSLQLLFLLTNLPGSWVLGRVCQSPGLVTHSAPHSFRELLLNDGVGGTGLAAGDFKDKSDLGPALR